MNLFKKFVADESGATAIEYGLIAALMAVVVIGAVAVLGPELEESFRGIGETLTGAEAAYDEATASES